MDGFDSLLRTQRAQKRQLAKLEAYIKDKATKSSSQWNSLLTTLLELKHEFIGNQEGIFQCLAGNAEQLKLQEIELDAFSDKCTDLTLTIREQIELWRVSQATTESQRGNSSNATARDDQLAEILRDLTDLHRQSSTPGRSIGIKPKLPQVELPKFNGAYSEWQSFFDAFKNTIHENSHLPLSLKMYYLKNSMTDDAALFVKHWKITDENYDPFWKALQDRYGKKVHIVHDCIDKFLSQSKMSSGSLESLKELTLNSKRIVWELKSMGPEYYTLDSWIIFLMKRLLDEDTRKSWEEKRTSSDLATVDEWFTFLEKRMDAMELWTERPEKGAAAALPTTKYEKKPQPKSNVKSHHTETTKCPKCSGGHLLYQCRAFKLLTLPEKRRFVFYQRVCYNCLRSNHMASECQSESTCIECNQRHHSLLHENPNSENASVPLPDPEESNQEETITTHHSTTRHRVLLPTALVNVMDSHGKKQVCRILIDGGGECNFISETCVQRLGLARRRARIAVNGTAEVTVGHTRGLVSLVLSSLHQPEELIRPEAYVLSKLTSLLPSSKVVEPTTWKHLRTLQLADPSFDTPGKIDIILGAEYAMSINLPQIIRSTDNAPVAQLTIFGWVLGGRICGETPTVHSFHTTTQSLDELLERFWEVEDIPRGKILTEEEQFCEEHFVQNVQRDETGRYEVRLPFKQNHAELGDSKSAASHRLHSMERKFEKNPEFHEQYVQFMREYLEKGHMEEVSADEVSIPNSESYVIPHMAVLRPSSTTTKLRVVYDASSGTRPNKVSLNDILAVGPTVQSDLVSILLNFRTHKYAFSADVEKMYRQVLVAPPDRDYMRIFWRETANELIHTYRLTTVTYGTACAPYLATRVLHQMAYDYKDDFPEAAEAICTGFYMDDLLGGAETLNAATQLSSNIRYVLGQGGFPLRKWSSNSPELLSSMPSDDLAVNPEEVINCSKSISLLGMRWSPGEDSLSVAVESMQEPSTMRDLCSLSARIYDPLGAVSPVTAALKMMFQKVWSCSIGWDDELPDEIVREFNTIREEIESLSQGYGAVLYARGIGQDHQVAVTLLIAKSRVAPRKPMTIPRLELCAALLLSRLVEKVKQALSSFTITVTAWTDSMVVLHWLRQHPSRWKTFVANRTDQILEIIPASQWRHVPTADNPADCISRGLSPHALIDHSLWLSGPAWLMENSDKWPATVEKLSSEISTGEEKPPMIQSHVVQKSSELKDTSDLFVRFSCLEKLIRIIAYILRWRYKKPKVNNLTVKELDSATDQLIKVVQKECFSEELSYLLSKKELKSGSKLAKLVPFLDDNGIIRVKGRIQNSVLCYDSRHPIVLPGKHIFTLKLIERAHLMHLHASVTLTQSVLRRKYWIIGERNSVKSVIHKCVPCFKAKPSAQTPMMGNLPAVRVRAARAFINTGCDFAGPFHLRASKLRKAQVIKGYICLFICMATKAVHLEVVSDLSTDAFIAALRRFTSRRGHCENLYCDNATNFIGAVQSADGSDKPKRLRHHQNRVVKFMSESGTQFHFIPAYSPTFGGLWERNIGSVKFHLKRVLTETKLTFEEMTTIVTQIEGCLNSRPLCPLSADPDDLQALTPGHFLIGQPLIVAAGPDYLANNPNRLTRWQLLQHLTQQFWKRWHAEYITSLQQRPKWLRNKNNLQIGDMVLVKSDNFKTGSWALGRILDVHPGIDSVVRVVTVKTSGGISRRGVNKLARLPIESS